MMSYKCRIWGPWPHSSHRRRGSSQRLSQTREMMMQPWIVLVLLGLLPLINGDVSHLPKDYLPPNADSQNAVHTRSNDAKEIQKDPSGFYPSTGLPLPPGYAIPTGSNIPPQPVQPPNFPLPIYPPFFGFGGGPGEQGIGPGIGPVPSAYPNGGPFPGGPPNAAYQQPPPGTFPGGPFPGGPQGGAGGFIAPQGGAFPPAAGFQPQGGPGNGFIPQGAPFPPQAGPFPPQGVPFAPQGVPGNAFPGGNFPPQEGPFPPQGGAFPPPGAQYPPEFLTNQGLPLTNPQGPFQGPNPAGFNVPVGFGGPVPGQNPYQQFGPGFGGPAPPGYSDEPEKEQPQKEAERTVVAPPLADDPKSNADTVYATNGGYVYQRAKK
ncbi:proline-rich protein HaeIII subfamily 1 [Drosophila eugracilis]|uniref:proline-rich protein HaeIII subfamily 1 n=1 Tax=Drosophila eugracilis TaxID=29029 RepID=UPI0007E73A7D|nr:proline-rich protein HaeIII subfamily 1 [Drosophila eugracilis]